MESLKLKFTSGNDIPVSQAVITHKEYLGVEQLERGFNVLDKLLIQTRKNHNDLIIEAAELRATNKAQAERILELEESTIEEKQSWHIAQGKINALKSDNNRLKIMAYSNTTIDRCGRDNY